MTILTMLPISPVPLIVGVLSFVLYGALLSHHTLLTVGLVGAFVSNVTITVPVPLFPIGSVSVTIGLLPVSIPLHVTAPPVLGFGLHVNHAILVVEPLSTGLNITTIAPLVGFGDTV